MDLGMGNMVAIERGRGLLEGIGVGDGDGSWRFGRLMIQMFTD